MRSFSRWVDFEDHASSLVEAKDDLEFHERKRSFCIGSQCSPTMHRLLPAMHAGQSTWDQIIQISLGVRFMPHGNSKAELFLLRGKNMRYYTGLDATADSEKFEAGHPLRKIFELSLRRWPKYHEQLPGIRNCLRERAIRGAVDASSMDRQMERHCVREDWALPSR